MSPPPRTAQLASVPDSPPDSLPASERAEQERPDAPTARLVVPADVRAIGTDLKRPNPVVALSPAADPRSQAWLNAQCAMIDGTVNAIVISRVGDSSEYQLLARWPDHSRDPSASLNKTAVAALTGGTPVVTSGDDDQNQNQDEGDGNGNGNGNGGNCFIATPLTSGSGATFVAAFELPASVRNQQRAILQLLQWGAVWFDLLHTQSQSSSTDRLTHVVEMLASSLEHAQFDAAATTAVTELATRLGCNRVSLGLLQGRSIKVCAISNSARVDTRSNLVREISAAMEEAIDQEATIAYPSVGGAMTHVAFAQEVLARRNDGCSVISTPMYDGNEPIGALTIEKDGEDGFDPASTQMCEAFASLLGPVVTLKKERERPLLYKAFTSFKEVAGHLFGPRRLALKLYSIALIVIVALLATVTADYRVTSTARLEGSVKRIVTAPRDGFVENATFRAGDRVESGQVLASLDARELELERTKLTSQHEQLNKEHRAAATSHDRSAAAVLNARKKQTTAQLALIDEQLKRSSLIAPFSGIVVSGDLSQNLGSPVEHGQVLFEIAPLDTYRVVLEVDERDIGNLREKQRGSLALTGMPDVTLPFTVERLTPVSTSREGRNFFEVHARLDETPNAIRPGMEGIGKVLIDRQKLIWIWTHGLVDWLRLSLWAWTS